MCMDEMASVCMCVCVNVFLCVSPCDERMEMDVMQIHVLDIRTGLCEGSQQGYTRMGPRTLLHLQWSGPRGGESQPL